MVPVYCAALVQPHAVLLYWLGFAAHHAAMQALLPAQPALLSLQQQGQPAEPSTTGSGASTPSSSAQSAAQGESSSSAPGAGSSEGGEAAASSPAPVPLLSDPELLAALGKHYKSKRNTQAVDLLAGLAQAALDQKGGQPSEAVQQALKELRS